MLSYTGFLTPVDIANRALQHCGEEMIDQSLGFAENSKAARQTSFCYIKLRQAELTRNTWVFATKKAVLRPIDSNTLQLAPALWVSTTTYFVGSIVADENNYFWISRVANNLNNEPQEVPYAWEPYFGPLSVMLYDSSTSYSAGELVYTAAGDGTYNVYMSLQNGNPVHPALPNQWSTNTTYLQNQVVQQFPAWAVGTTYAQGASVVYTDGLIYSSLTNGNIGHIPPTSPTFWAIVPTLTLASQPVPVSTIVAPPTATPVKEWAQTTTYTLGSVIMFGGLEYLSVANSNTGNFPNAAGSTFWKPLTLGTLYMSLINLNFGNNPSNSPALWSITTTYGAAALVAGSDGIIYSSLAGGNLGHDPTATTGFWANTGTLVPWTILFTQGGGNDLWRQIGGSSFPMGVGLTSFNIAYPLGSGPSAQEATRNVFRLPAAFLRPAPQDPKAGAISYLGAPCGLMATDWTYENNFIVSTEAQPIMLRFVADVADVTQFNAMFCEGLAFRMALHVCEPLTQSSSKKTIIAKEYEKFMTEARLIDGVERGFEEPPIDDWIAARM